MMSFNHSSRNDQQGQVYEHNHAHNTRAPSDYPQLEDRSLTSYTFLDFITPNKHATIPIIGAAKSLESLDYALSPGVFARRAPGSNAFSAYTPLAIALNTICAKVGLDPITEHDLAQLQRTPWFLDFAKASLKQHKFDNMSDLNLTKLASDTCLSEDHMVLLAEAFAASHDLSNIELGIVAVTKKGVKAFHYPWTATCKGLTAWIVADCRTDEPTYYGLGREVVEHQEGTNELLIGEEEEHQNEEEDDADDEDQEVPTTTPRKTAARVLAQQVPLPAGLSAKDILMRHIDNLQYNNILKVGLHYSNQEIAKKVAEDAEGKNKKFSTGASGMVKRINTGIDFIEKEYEMDVGAFRTAYDTARKSNGIPIRGKDGVHDQILAANASKINDAMAWVRAGGPRPAPVAPAPVASTPVSAGYAPAPSVSSNSQGPVGARHGNNIPQFDGAPDEPDYHHDDTPQAQSNGFLTQLNDDAMEWDSMFNSDGIFNFDNFN